MVGRRYCPEASLTRAEGAVFTERGVHGAGFQPPQPSESLFTDVALSDWFADWTMQLWEDGYTAGCGVDPLRFCPSRGHTRAEAAVFFLKMLKGANFLPQGGGEMPYVDVPEGAWYHKWVAAAYMEGIVTDCEPPQGRGDDLFRPEEDLTRAEAACMMVRAKGMGGAR
jgi:hypothetical protein